MFQKLTYPWDEASAFTFVPADKWNDIFIFN